MNRYLALILNRLRRTVGRKQFVYETTSYQPRRMNLCYIVATVVQHSFTSNFYRKRKKSAGFWKLHVESKFIFQVNLVQFSLVFYCRVCKKCRVDFVLELGHLVWSFQ